MIGAHTMLTYTVLYTYLIFVMGLWSSKGLCGLVVRMLGCNPDALGSNPDKSKNIFG